MTKTQMFITVFIFRLRQARIGIRAIKTRPLRILARMSAKEQASVLTPSSSFSMPEGRMGTPRLMAVHSPRSGTSSARYIGIGFEGSSCLDLKDNLVVIFEEYSIFW